MNGGRIHLFRCVLKYQRWMGIYSIESNKSAPFNYRSVFFRISLAHFSIPTLLFFVFKAYSFKDYAGCLYAFISSFACTSHHTMQTLHIRNFEMLTRKFEEFIEQSKCIEAREFIDSILMELFTKCSYFVMHVLLIPLNSIDFIPFIHSFILRFISFNCSFFLFKFFIPEVNARHQYYAKLNKYIELFSKLMYFSVYLSVANIILPQFFLSYINFFIFGLGSESFYLPFPNM